MNKGVEYEFADPPSWACRLDDRMLRDLVVEDDEIKKAKEAGKGICYLSDDTVQTCETFNGYHTQKMWLLGNSDTLQGASVCEFQLRRNDHFLFHYFAVLRNGQWIDKRDDLVIRMLDDEKTSQVGSINKLRKLHVVINDLRLGDILLEEYSTISIFSKEEYIDHQYFRHIVFVPVGYWYYRRYAFRCLNERQIELRVRKNYIRDSVGVLLPEEDVRVPHGEVYEFVENNRLVEQPQNSYVPEIMICNNATWEEVSSYVAERFAADNVHRDLKKHPIFRELSLGDLSIPLDERIRKVIEYTQNEIIYLYDAEVMHGHFPQDPETTLERRAGDCKAKSLLLIDLLATLGIDADFILVNTESDNLLKRTTPTPFVFNHAIVRIKKDEKEYFVDPTWTYRAGVLGKRTEPLFFHYLVVAHNMDLSTRNEILLGDPVLKEEISVIIRKGEAKILILSKCMRASADNFRIILNRGGIAEVTRVWSTYIMQYLSYSEQKSVDTLFTDITLKVISDDQSENKIEVRHELTLPNAYQLANGTRVFKFYHPLASGEIRNFAHRDAPCVHFAGYPVKQVLVIDSDYFIKDDNTTKKTLTLSNNYFDFSNKKKTTLKKITVTTEYTPKKYALISSDELEEIQLAYQKIDDSNNGVGVVFISIPEFIKKQWYLCLVLIWLLLAFLKFLH